MIKDVLENSVSLIHFQENALYMYDKIEKDTKNWKSTAYKWSALLWFQAGEHDRFMIHTDWWYSIYLSRFIIYNNVGLGKHNSIIVQTRIFPAANTTNAIY